MARVFNPTVPFKTHLSGPFLPGSSIEIDGSVNAGGNRIEINLDNAAGGHVLHFNPRIGQAVVFNNNHTGGWGKEERPPGMPFAAGSPFSIKFTSTPTHIIVNVNGAEFHKFGNRGQPIDIVSVEVSGDVQIQHFEESHDVLVLPHHTPLLGKAHAGRHIYICGKPTGPRFEVNFKRRGDVAFHLNPRFDQNAVVRNTCVGGGWGGEERNGDFPFVQGKDFHLHIICENDKFKVLIDGRLHHEFRYRGIQPHEIDDVEVKGDVILTECCS